MNNVHSVATVPAHGAVPAHAVNAELRRRLPHLDARALRLCNSAYGAAHRSRFAVGDQVYSWHWRYRRTAPTARDFAVLESSLGAIGLALDNDFTFAASLHIEWRALSGEARLVAWSLRYEPVVLQLQRLLGADLEPRAIATGQLPAPAAGKLVHLDFSILDAKQNRVLSGTVLLGEQVDSRHLEAGNDGAASSAADWVPIRLRVAVADIELPLAALRSVEIADVLRIGTPALVREHALIALVPLGAPMRFLARIQGARAVLQRIASGAAARATVNHKGSFAMSSVTEDAVSAAAPTDQVNIDTLPVALSFTVGELTLTVGELKRLSPGYAFDLQRKLEDSPVTVLANGEPFASGEFVLVNDFLGVRIIELRQHGPR